MQKVKIIVRNYATKKGGTFTKITIGGKYLNDVLADENETYQVKFTKKSLVAEPTQDGVYEVAFENGGAWIDGRDDSKHIYRINAVKVKFNKPLPRFEHDIRDGAEAKAVAETK